MSRIRRFLGSPAGFVLSGIVLAPLLVGAIVFGFQAITGSGSESHPTESATPSPTGTDESSVIPEFVPGGTAIQNKPYFDYVNRQTVALTPNPAGRAFVDALVAAGFDRAAMQLTPDTTAADLTADSIQFSVQVGEQCLIGQWGTGSQGYRSTVAPVVTGIGCLIGETRAIDW